MFADMTTSEVLKLLLPIFIVQFSLLAFTLVLIWTKGVKNLNKILWSAIVIFINIVGPIVFLLYGRKKWSDNQI